MLSLLLQEATDADATAWANSVRAAGGVVSGNQVRRVSRLIRGLKADGVWSSLDRLWLFAAENSTQARTDLKARVSATPTNGPTFTANRGYTGDGLSAYIETSFTPSSAGGNFVQNSAGFGIWVVTAPSTTGGVEIGGETGAPFCDIGVRFTSTNWRYAVNSSAASAAAHGNAWTGDFHAQRTAAAALALYNNGASVATDTTSSASLSTGTIVVCASRAPSPTAFSTAQIGAAWIGASLSAGQVTAFYNRKRTYMTAVGVP